jgi:hypothetical protein
VPLTSVIAMRSSKPPYDDLINMDDTTHLRYFANFHGLTIASASELILSCKGDRRFADEAAIAFKAHFKQSI